MDAIPRMYLRQDVETVSMSEQPPNNSCVCCVTCTQARRCSCSCPSPSPQRPPATMPVVPLWDPSAAAPAPHPSADLLPCLQSPFGRQVQLPQPPAPVPTCCPACSPPLGRRCSCPSPQPPAPAPTCCPACSPPLGRRCSCPSPPPQHRPGALPAVPLWDAGEAAPAPRPSTDLLPCLQSPFGAQVQLPQPPAPAPTWCPACSPPLGRRCSCPSPPPQRRPGALPAVPLWDASAAAPAPRPSADLLRCLPSPFGTQVQLPQPSAPAPTCCPACSPPLGGRCCCPSPPPQRRPGALPAVPLWEAGAAAPASRPSTDLLPCLQSPFGAQVQLPQPPPPPQHRPGALPAVPLWDAGAAAALAPGHGTTTSSSHKAGGAPRDLFCMSKSFMFTMPMVQHPKWGPAVAYSALIWGGGRGLTGGGGGGVVKHFSLGTRFRQPNPLYSGKLYLLRNAESVV